ncbi:MAG: cellulase [Chitinophagaceae bacterium]|nr:cellulase [Chitinophagaceae bacterium]
MISTRIVFIYLVLFTSSFAVAQDDRKIMLNQVGFYPSASKLAVVTGNTASDHFYIIKKGNRDTVYKGELAPPKHSAYSSLITRIADFSSLKKTGNFYVVVPGSGESFSFVIKEHAYHDAATGVLKAFYFIRSDMPLQPAYAGKWSRPAGHPDTNVLVHASAASSQRPTGTIISTPGGWYDAGDYNKYVVNSGITMGTLLSAYEEFPAYYNSLHTNIPESKDAIPDILNEAFYNLRWMLSMQDPNDGGVYHKCTNAAFDGMVMPGVTKSPRYVVQKSTAAALDFAAVMAQAARIAKRFKNQLPGFSDSCIAAAEKAWQWSQKNPSVIYSQAVINPKYNTDITTGEYGDRMLNDEWLWAATELFTTTQNKIYFAVTEQRMKDRAMLPSWGNVGMLAYYTLIRNEKQLPSYSHELIHAAKDTIIHKADDFLNHVGANAFATVMGQSAKDFVWGSNAVAANQGILLINAYFISKQNKYLAGAVTNADYLLGRNATGYCFITGYGSQSPMHPHHRPSVADGILEPVPGLLAGGPNPGMQDKCFYKYKETETAYTDDDCAYASNEIAINWNAPAVYLLNAIEALFVNRK